MKFETWGLEAKKKKFIIYNLEDESRKASKLISSIFNSETLLCLSVSLCLANLLCIFFPTAVKISMLRILMGWRLCSELASSFLFWQYYKFEGARWGRMPGVGAVGGCSRGWRVVGLLHCIAGGEKPGYFYSRFNKHRAHFLGAYFVRLCVMDSDSKDSLDLLPFPAHLLPRALCLLPDLSILFC